MSNSKAEDTHSISSSSQFAIEFLVSGTAAVVSKTLASPIEVIKIRLQLQAPLIQKKLIEHPYEGIIDCFKRLYIEEGWRAYYKGNFVNVLRYFPTQALNFAFKDFYLRKFELDKLKPDHTFFDTFFNNLKGGSLAGASTQCFVYPLDYTRTRLTNDIVLAKLGDRKRQFNGILDCMQKTYKSDGLRGLYRGFVVTCTFMMVYRGMYFGLNAGVKEQVPQVYLNNILLSFLISYCVTVASGVIGYPMDTIRRRMMMSSGE
jgi:solute carrier family 25 (mitochondrial adenine nucleotide translocator), member 4/5/6/31